MRRGALGVGAVLLGALVSGCGSGSRSPGSSGTGTGASQDPARASIVFLTHGPQPGPVRAGVPSGVGAVAVSSVGAGAGSTLSVSDDGRVAATSLFSASGQLPGGLMVLVDGVATVVPGTEAVRAVDVSGDGSAVYYVTESNRFVGSIHRYDVASASSSIVCADCVPVGPGMVPHATVLVVSDDGRRAAVTQGGPRSNEYGSPTVTRVTVLDLPAGTVRWSQDGVGAQSLVAWSFADDDTLIATRGEDAVPEPTLVRITGLGGSASAVVDTKVHGYGPVSRLDGVWWYYRDTASGQTDVLVNADLTTTGERTLATRPDGASTYAYVPVTSMPARPSPAPSAVGST
jgi:hypothetical protein